MPSVDDKSPEGEDPLEPHSINLQPALHSAAFSRMSMHIYPFPNALMPAAQQPLRSKRRQVKNACTHCQKACKKCDDARPCLRCVKYGFSEECVNSTRKERKKGVKRGPYKKRDGKDRAGSNVTFAGVPQPGLAVSNNVPPIPGSYMPLGYPGFYAQHPTMVSKPGEAPTMYMTPYYAVLAGSPHPNATSDRENQPYMANGFYPPPGLAPIPYAAQYPTTRPDGPSAHDEYPVYPGPAYQKPSSATSNGSYSKPGEKGADRTHKAD